MKIQHKELNKDKKEEPKEIVQVDETVQDNLSENENEFVVKNNDGTVTVNLVDGRNIVLGKSNLPTNYIVPLLLSQEKIDNQIAWQEISFIYRLLLSVRKIDNRSIAQITDKISIDRLMMELGDDAILQLSTPYLELVSSTLNRGNLKAIKK